MKMSFKKVSTEGKKQTAGEHHKAGTCLNNLYVSEADVQDSNIEDTEACKYTWPF